ncbi:hypothetical protein M9H77_34108 [Catharanthus roseus]|uniref:Uncharacterized protein n=1 Tax=Catharanthus roseus TaxID=4058 RepID=A0ACB9ZKZ1_CATRO|nr:hypothetical protein M9H77_34108 [Catharanthus roseus]
MSMRNYITEGGSANSLVYCPENMIQHLGMPFTYDGVNMNSTTQAPQDGLSDTFTVFLFSSQCLSRWPLSALRIRKCCWNSQLLPWNRKSNNHSAAKPVPNSFHNQNELVLGNNYNIISSSGTPNSMYGGLSNVTLNQGNGQVNYVKAMSSTNNQLNVNLISHVSIRGLGVAWRISMSVLRHLLGFGDAMLIILSREGITKVRILNLYHSNGSGWYPVYRAGDDVDSTSLSLPGLAAVELFFGNFGGQKMWLAQGWNGPLVGLLRRLLSLGHEKQQLEVLVRSTRLGQAKLLAQMGRTRVRVMLGFSRWLEVLARSARLGQAKLLGRVQGWARLLAQMDRARRLGRG